MANSRLSLQRLRLRGFKSIRDATITFDKLIVLIGANGAGKSNLVSFFSLLHELAQERLQEWVGRAGGADSVLHLGSKTTSAVDMQLDFTWGTVRSSYQARLGHAAPDRLAVESEQLRCHFDDAPSPRIMMANPGGTWESVLKATAFDNNPAALNLHRLCKRSLVYHFHDTSNTARVRLGSLTGDTRWLNPDGSNLAAMLFAYQTSAAPVYRRIVSTLRLLFPAFDDFVLEPDRASPGKILLFWRQLGSDYLFGPHQLSDGTLRAMCLVTLLLQAEEDLPQLLIIDEPELGLHPSSLNIVAALLRMAAHKIHVVVATQSPRLLDEFDPEQVIVVDREGSESKFRRLDAAKTNEWLEDYSLGEVWEKNVFGGGPH